MSGDVHTPTSAGPDPAAQIPGQAAPGAAAPPFDEGEAERPEVFVGAAFAGGLVAALILKRLTRDDD
jgi:hypothetical protein